MSAGVTQARARQQGGGAVGVETLVDHAAPRVQGPDKASRLTTDNDPESANANGVTPLMRAAGDGSVDFVQVLLDLGADVNAKRNDGFNALALAAFFGHSQVVQLLLARGADVEATARGASAEIWADVRGFIGTGDLLRTTRAKKNTSEPAPHQQENQDSGTVLETKPVKAVAVEENKSHVGVEHHQSAVVDVTNKQSHRTVTAPPSRPSKALPEIQDIPPMIAPEFHPGAVFVARISSSWKNLAALMVVALVIGGMATFALPQIVRSLTGGQTKGVTNTTDLPAATDPVAQPEQNVSSQLETPPAQVQLETSAPLKSTETTSDSKSIESAHQSESAEVQPTTSSVTAKTDTTENAPSSRRDNRISKAFAYPRGLSLATTMFHAPAAARKQKPVSASEAKPKQQASDPEPKPAPISVEVSRSRTNLSTADAANQGSVSQSPLSITPNQSRTKVIRWP